MTGVTAFIVAGGKSSRMGADKAFVELGARTLLQIALGIAGSVARDVRIVGPSEKFQTFAPTIADIYQDRGPLGGIHAALESTLSHLNLILAVDTPFVTAEFLSFLIGEARNSDAVVTVPKTKDGFHPLCGVYRRSFLDAAETALQAGRNKIDALFELVETRVIDEAELRKAGFDVAMFRNLNTPEELHRAMEATAKHQE